MGNIADYNNSWVVREERSLKNRDYQATLYDMRHRPGWDDGPGHNLMPDEIAKMQLDKFVEQETFYAAELLSVACNGWYLMKGEDMAHLDKWLNVYRERRIEQEAIYNELSKKYRGQ